MRLFLVRHAEAASGDPDELRSLTPGGREAARALGEKLAAQRPEAVLSSPLLRARETAEQIARAAGVHAEPDDRLAPGATSQDVRAAVAGRGETVVAVGHQPDCSTIVFELTGRQIKFAPAAVFVVHL
ncbi:MAG: SixA phosphatase family protein [Gaiellaceae bacterium]